MNDCIIVVSNGGAINGVAIGVFQLLLQRFDRVFRWPSWVFSPRSGKAAQRKEIVMAQSDAHSPPESSDEEGSSNRQTESGYGKRDGSTDQIEQSAVLSSSGEKGPESEKPESEIRESQRGKISGIAVGDLTTDEASVVERVLDSAYEYVAINTAHPKLPGRLPFSLTVQVLRCLRGMTQHQLAQASDVKQCYVSMI